MFLNQLIIRPVRKLNLHSPSPLHHLEPLQHLHRLRRIRRGAEGNECLALTLDAAFDVDIHGRELHEVAEGGEPGFLREDLGIVVEAFGVNATEVEGAVWEGGVLHCGGGEGAARPAMYYVDYW